MASFNGQVVRSFSTSARLLKQINIQKPRTPWTERRILTAVTTPIYPKDPRPLPIKCFEEQKEKKASKETELSLAYEAFREKMTAKMFTENKMVAICHILPMTSRDAFNVRIKIVTAGMKMMFAKPDWARKTVRDTRLRNLEPYLVSDNVYIVSEESMVPELVSALRQTPELQLLGGLVEDRIMSRDEMMNIAKLPPLDIMRGELLTILSASVGKTSRLLGRHQQELSSNLEQLIKQGGPGVGGGADGGGSSSSSSDGSVGVGESGSESKDT